MTGRVDAAHTHGLAGPKAAKRISLALQGGGAHGAYTWGVLDALLEDGRLAIEAMTGASAGAMNAVVLADGWLDGGADGARAQLETFWRRVSLDGGLTDAQRGAFDGAFGFWSSAAGPFTNVFSEVWQQTVSPYQSNPLDLNPLRDVLDG